jgi:uncharacterized delta-60 repeat protein
MRTCAIGVLVIGACLLAAPVDAREGDLDPAFGDVGRVGPIASVPGTAWSIYAMENGSLVIGGGEVSLSCPSDIIGCVLPRYVGFAARSFLIRVSDAGEIDESFQVAAIRDFHLLAIARQRDGKFVAAGRRLNERSLDSEFVVYRLNQDGSLDTGFGANGRVQLPAAERGDVDEATAVLVEPDGRIVVAGSRLRSDRRSEILIRLLANGDIDHAFGSSGIVVLPGRSNSLTRAVQIPLWRTQVLRTAAGAYRVSVPNWCDVVGLTPDGTFDSAFGSSGTVQIHHPISNSCMLIMAMQDDGRLVVGASDGEAAVVTRLLANGQPDLSFLRGTDIHHSVGFMITAMAVGPDGAIVIAQGLSDFGYHGLTIKRLLPSGELDASFGNAGSTAIDMPSEFGSVSLLFDMLVREEGTVVAAGGNPFASASHGPIIVRLLGAGAGDGPGVLGVTPNQRLEVDEQLADFLVEVRRTGGDAGHASVAYQVFADDDASAATVGKDFVADAGRLEWEDGDATNRQIRVRIINDDLPEDEERITVLLTDAEGGVGLGRTGQIVKILANDGFVPPPPPSRLGFALPGATVGEAGGSVVLNVSRSGAADGAVSVRYATSSGSAIAGSDFTNATATLTWADGDTAAKPITVNITNDSADESDETFTVTLSNPTGGATLGPNRAATVTITDDDSPPPPPPPPPHSVLSLDRTEAAVGEVGGSVVLNVSRSGSAAGTVSVNYATSSGSAIAGSDFTNATGTLTWADGDTAAKSITVNLTNDSADESDETFTVTLWNPSTGAGLGSNSSATVTITDDDAPPSPPPSRSGSSGGGSFGFLSLLLLAVVRFLRSAWTAVRSHS